VRLELDRRQVDRDRDALGPIGGFGAGRAEDPFANLVDKADFLGERDEFDRADRPLLGMFPADQGFKARNRLARGVDARRVERPVRV
jgi:hypothetical protein